MQILNAALIILLKWKTDTKLFKTLVSAGPLAFAKPGLSPKVGFSSIAGHLNSVVYR